MPWLRAARRMSEFDEYYRKVSDAKCIREWEKIKKHYDKVFKGE